MTIIKYSAPRPALALRELTELPNRLGRFFDFNASDEALGWVPPVDIFETKDEIVIATELPGLTQDDVSVELENGILTIGGEKKPEPLAENGDGTRIRLNERRYGTFRRAFTLPRTVVSVDDVSASFSNGVLTVRLPKATEAKGRRIEISS